MVVISIMKGIFQSILGLAGISRPRFPSMDKSSFPSLSSEHPATAQLSAWLAAFNSGEKERLLSYHESNSPDDINGHQFQGIEQEFAFAQMIGGFDVAEIESTSITSSVVVVLKEKKVGKYARLSMEIDISKPNRPVTSFDLRAINTPLKYIPQDHPRRSKYEKAYRPLTTVLRRKIVDGLAEVLQQQYVSPESGEEIIRALRSHLDRGEYETFEDSEKFARRLTEDLAAAGHDKHMSIDFVEPADDAWWNIFQWDIFRWRSKKTDLEELHRMDMGFGPTAFDKVSVPGKTIATLPINVFLPSDKLKVRTAIAEIMSSVADADALLLDLRENCGGDANTIAFIESYLLDHGPLHLVDFVDRFGNVKESFSTRAEGKLPAGSKRFGGSKPLIVLTSKDTISGGECMAYDLQATQRAAAVIGENETTAGAAHPLTDVRFICEDEFGKSWWIVAVPNLKPEHKITGTNWQGVGVRSDVIAGEGEWQGVGDAKEVATSLLKKLL